MTANAEYDEVRNAARAAVTSTEIEVFADDVAVRRSGRIPRTNPNQNVVTRIDSGTYQAWRQCAGSHVTEGGSANYYWVDIDANDEQAGWISAVFVRNGQDDHPQPDKAGNIIPVRFYGECEDPPFADPNA